MKLSSHGFLTYKELLVHKTIVDLVGKSSTRTISMVKSCSSSHLFFAELLYIRLVYKNKQKSTTTTLSFLQKKIQKCSREGSRVEVLKMILIWDGNSIPLDFLLANLNFGAVFGRENPNLLNNKETDITPWPSQMGIFG